VAVWNGLGVNNQKYETIDHFKRNVQPNIANNACI